MDLQKKKEMLIKYFIDSGVLHTKEIISAFRSVRRENFVADEYKNHAYADEPLPIKEGQTISQPCTVAAMTEALQPQSGQKILEIGAGSGYQAAILSDIAGANGFVFSVERIISLAEFAENNLKKEKVRNVKIIVGDGTLGYEKKAPYDRIIVTASAPSVPQALVDQLKNNGRMVIPVGQDLVLIEKDAAGKTSRTFLGNYVFVPLIGKYGHKKLF